MGDSSVAGCEKRRGSADLTPQWGPGAEFRWRSAEKAFKIHLSETRFCDEIFASGLRTRMQVPPLASM